MCTTTHQVPTFFSTSIKYAIIDHTSVALMCTDGVIRRQNCISCHCGGRQICSCFAARGSLHYTAVWERTAPAVVRDIAVDIRYIFSQTYHFFFRSSFAPMLCLTVVPFVELDADKCIQHQCHARALVTCEMR